MRVLVTGGSGFLGKAIVKKLVELNYEVSYISRHKAKGLDDLDVKWFEGSIENLEIVEDSLKDQNAVIHTAAKAGYWGSRQSYYQTNVVGTQNIINACVKHKVNKLVFTSSPSIVFNGNDLKGVDESIEIPNKHLCYYSETKSIAERLVLTANGNKNLATVSIRPHLIYGPGDNHLLPRVIKSAKAGKLKIVGDGLNKVDVIYIDNAVEAHVKALKVLELNHVMAGRAYFVADDEPVILWEWLNHILNEMDIKPISKRISKSTAYNIGAVIEFFYKLFNMSGEPPMTRFVAESLATNHYFNCDNAKNDWDYKTIVGPKNSLSKTISSLTR
ncbi:MAG: hypothetical protein COA79_07680 [Planctomycetota bacterium]|nr:MAG: hypothetical protein COA79_07680 [Planctomycetota bacterium]